MPSTRSRLIVVSSCHQDDDDDDDESNENEQINRGRASIASPTTTTTTPPQEVEDRRRGGIVVKHYHHHHPAHQEVAADGGHSATTRSSSSSSPALQLQEGAAPSRWRERAVKVTDGAAWGAVFTSATFVALFAADITTLALPASADRFVHGLLFAVFVLFTIEMVVLSCVDEHYLFKRRGTFVFAGRTRALFTPSSFFLLDLATTFAIMPDVPVLRVFVLAVFNESSDDGREVTYARAGLATQVGARATRLFKLLRVLRVIRLVRFARYLKVVRWLSRLFAGGPGKGEVDGGYESATFEDAVATMPREFARRVYHTVAQRTVAVVLMVMITIMLLEVREVDRSYVLGLQALDAFNATAVNQLGGDDLRAYHDVLHLYGNGTEGSDTLLRLVVSGREEVSRPDDHHLSHLRDANVHTIRIEGTQSMAVFDTLTTARANARLSIVGLLLVLLWLLATSFLVAKDFLRLLVHPVRCLTSSQRFAELLLGIYKSISNNTDIDAVFSRIALTVSDVIGADRVAVYFFNPNTQHIWSTIGELRAQGQIRQTDRNHTRKEMSELPSETYAFLQQLAISGGSYNSQDDGDGRHYQKPKGVRSVLAVCMKDPHDATRTMVVVQASNKHKSRGSTRPGVLRARGDALWARVRRLLLLGGRGAAGRVEEAGRQRRPPRQHHHPEFTSHDEVLLASFLGQIAVVLRTKIVEEILENVVDTDPSADALAAELLHSFRPAVVGPGIARSSLPSLSEGGGRGLAGDDDDNNDGDDIFAGREFARARNFFGRDGGSRWEFDVLALDASQLLPHAAGIFEATGIVSEFDLPREKLGNYLRHVVSGYNDVPYHNKFHALSVLHSCFLFVQTTAAANCLNNVDLLALLLGSVGHDMGHKGFNNAFHIAAYDKDVAIPDLAIVYNDLAVLENYHASRCRRLLQQPGCAVTEVLQAADRKEAETILCQAILATDMSHHFAGVAEFASHEAFSVENQEDRRLMVCTLMHAADLANPVMEMDQAVAWALMVAREFKQQAETERAMGLPVTVFMDLQGDIVATNPAVAKLNLGFIDHIAAPLWKALHDVFPELEPQILLLATNRAFWLSKTKTSLVVHRRHQASGMSRQDLHAVTRQVSRGGINNK